MRSRRHRPQQVRVVRPGEYGWSVPGGGAASGVEAAPVWRGTTVQVCGLWPWAAGSGTPPIGVPLGRHLATGATVCCDPISWFQRAKLISNPSAFVLGMPGLGKSTMVRRMVIGCAGYGVIPVVLGDLKPDYVDVVAALGGQVITLGRGRGHINVLDPGEATAAAVRLRAAGYRAEADQVVADAHGRRHTMVSALITILRGSAPSDREETILDRSLRVLDDAHDGRAPVLGDLLTVIRQGPDEVRAVALDRGDVARYRAITEDLEASLIGLTGGRLGEQFSQQTDVAMVADRPVVYDVSAINESDTALQAATLLACWSGGFGTINIANTLSSVGLAPQRHYLIVLDELWRALGAGQGMVDRINALTRLNRQVGVGMMMISHTMKDLESLASESDRLKARGFVERSGMVIAGGLPAAEMPLLESAVRLSRAEQETLMGWQTPPAWSSRGEDTAPPGRGNFLIKVGGRPGIPVHVQLTSAELAVNDTNKLWHQRGGSDGASA